MEVEGQPNVEGQNQTDINERLAQLEQTNKRLLDESKKWKERYQQTAEVIESKETEIISKEKDINKRLEMEQKAREKAAKEAAELKYQLLQQNIQNTVSKYAKDVNDIEDLLNQPRYAEILKRGIDKESLSLDEEVAKEYVETVLKSKPYLRKAPDATTVMTSKPSYKQGGAINLDAMTDKEIEQMLFEQYGNK